MQANGSQKFAAMKTLTKMPVPQHSGIFKLHLEAQATLDTVGVRESIKLPEGVKTEEWIACKVLGIFEEVSMLVSLLQDVCAGEMCSCMNAGKSWKYRWADEENPKPTSLSAKEYMSNLISFSYKVLSDRELLPIDGSDFPPSFLGHMQTLLKRFFRVYAHAYVCHFRELSEHGAEAHVNCCFKHWLFFVREFDLVSHADMEPLWGFIKKIDDPKKDQKHQSRLPPLIQARKP